MQTPQPMNNSKIAIIGMNAHFGAYTLDAFERSIYEGQHLSDADNVNTLSSVELQRRFDRIATIALSDAAIANTNIAMVVANNSQHRLDSVIEVDSVFDALLMAQKLLNDVEAVVVGGVDLQGIGVVVLKRYRTAKRDATPRRRKALWVAHQDSDRHKIYAVIDSLNLSPAVKAKDIAYLEVTADKRLEEIEIEQRIPDYLAADSTRSCAVSSVANAGYKGTAGEIASLIKTALCLYYRYIPPVSGWQQQTPKDWQLYVTSVAKPWFLEAGVKQRVAAISVIDRNAQIVLAEELEPQKRSNAYLEQTPCYLFPLVANAQTLLEQIDTLKQTIANSDDLAQTAKQTFIKYRHSEGDYALAIVGKNKAEILKECDRAAKGVTKAFETGKDWQTPVGSYFTPNPLGKKGKVAYVYPGAYNAHLGLGKDLFRLFPNLIDDPVIQSTCNRIAGIEKLLYPRSWHQLAPKELEAKERELMNDPLVMLESETGFAGFMTTILRDYFQVKPQAAFGYSLGETSMMYAQGVWDDIEQSSNLLNASSLFKTRLAGKKEAVREYWQLSDEPGELWRTYVVMANSEAIQEKLKAESRVYLTQISTPKEAVIAGDPQGCERVIASLGCDAFRAPFNHVIHCPPMNSEYDRLIELNTLPLRKSPEITFYSAADYQEIVHTSKDIAHSVTQTLCQQLDFPRLVDRVYQDDYRIFIEVGVGSNCSRWIKDILKSKEQAVISIHRRGTNDFTSLIKAIALLFSHRTQLDLSLLYGKDSSLKVVSSTRDNTSDPWQENIPERVKDTQPIQVVNDKKVVNKAYKKIAPVINRTSISNQLNSKTILENNDNNLILWQPNYLKTAQDGSINNNSQISKAQSIFITRDREYSKNHEDTIGVHLQLLEKVINRSIKTNE